MNANDQLQELFKKLNSEATLSPHAAKQFSEAVETVAQQSEQIEKLKLSLETKGTEYQQLRNKLSFAQNASDELSRTIAEWKEREADLKTRENEIRFLEQEAYFERTRTQDHKDMMQTVFKNVEVRRQVTRTCTSNTTEQDQNGYMTPKDSSSETTTTDTTTTED